MYKLLDLWDKEKKDKHDRKFHEQRKHFSPLFLSADGILGKEALVVLTNVIWLMVEKPEKYISHVRGWVNGWIEITVKKSYSHTIRGARLPSPLRDQETDCYQGSGISLA